METWQKISMIYITILNAAGFISMGIDKNRAKHHAWRIPEKTLFLIAILGGSFGSMLGMQVFRHKTKHMQFKVGMPLIFAVQAIIVAIFSNHMLNKNTSRTDFSMGTVITETIYGQGSEDTASGVIKLIQDLDEQELSWREDASSIASLNRELENAAVSEVPQRTAGYIRDSLTLCEDSGGALDITIHPLIDLWGIESETPAVPSADAIEDALRQTGYTGITVTDSTHIRADRTGYSIDLGAVGKGIAADEVRAYLDEQDDIRGNGTTVRGAVVSIGGTILTYGTKPGNVPWQVGIRNPRGSQDSYLGYLSIDETTVISTSGDYEQYFEEDGIRYHHIFNPATGYPAESGLMSVTVICESGLYSDGLSTACFILGYEDSLPLLEKYHAEAVFVTTENQIYITDGLQDSFTLTNGNYDCKSTQCVQSQLLNQDK